MANAFDLANLSVLTLLSYARDQYGAELTLRELADTIEGDAEEFFANNESGETDKMLTEFMAKAVAGAFRELAENNYELDDLLTGVTNLLPDEAIDEITGEAGDEDEDEEELDDEDDEESDEDDEEELDEEEDEEDLDEEEDEDEDEDEDGY